MTAQGAQALATALMLKHGLHGWTFGFDRKLKYVGMCYGARRHISLSIHFVERNSIADVTDTILHEIAHALVGCEHGHGPVWQKAAMALGATPSPTCGAHVDMPAKPWQATCVNCRRTYGKWRKPKSVRLCRYCRTTLTYVK